MSIGLIAGIVLVLAGLSIFAAVWRKPLMARIDAALDSRRRRKAVRQAPSGGPDDWHVRLLDYDGPSGYVTVCVLDASGDPDPAAAASLAAYVAATGILSRYLDTQQLASIIREVSP